MQTRPLAAAALALILGTPAPAAAHAADMGSLELVLEGDRLQQSLTLSGASLGSLVALDADGDGVVAQADLDARLVAIFEATLGREPPRADVGPCDLRPVAATGEGSVVRLRAEGRCPAKVQRLRHRLAFLSDLSEGHRILVQATLDGRRYDRVADRSAQVLAFEREKGRGLGAFVWLGVEHIFGGWDHLVFLLALVLAGGGVWRLLGIVSAFTAAHSITLALAALSVVNLPGRWVEAAIALSIMYVAAENLLGAREERRWAIAFLFGLVHGFGFASALTEARMPRDGLFGALLGFNLGVEAGQAALVLAVVPLLAWARRLPSFLRYGLPSLSLASLAAGAYWFVGRVL